MKRLGALLALVAACRPTATVPPEPTTTPSVGGLATLAEPEAPETTKSEAGLDPAPPLGLPLPPGVTVVDVTDGGGRASFVWRGWFAGNPADPRISARVGQWYADGIERSATEAAYELYLEDVRAAGFSTESFDLASGRGFDFALSEGDTTLDAIVRLIPSDADFGSPDDPDDPYGLDDPDDPYAPEVEVIEVIVGGRGG